MPPMRVAVLLASIAWLCSGAKVMSPTGRVARGEYIVLMNSNATESELHEVFASVRGERKFSIGSAFKSFHAKLSPEMLTWVASHPAVNIIEHNQIITTSAHDSPKVNCPSYQRGRMSWGQRRLTASSPRDVLADFVHDVNWGRGIDVYVVDTGVRCTHKEFVGGRCIHGTNIVGGSDTDINGHGTHCAGTIAGATYGIAKSATIISVKVLGDGGFGTTASIIAGIEWTVANAKSRKRPSVGNLSLGGGHSTTLNTAIDAASNEGITFAVAAGNDNNDACRYSPASATSVVTVAATTAGSDGVSATDMRSPSSNYGTCTDIFAPGTGIISAYATSDDSYATLSGTSMASPHVAGVMATLLSTAEATPSNMKSTLLASSAKGVLDILSSPDRFLHLHCRSP